MAGGYIGGVASIDRGTNYYTREQADKTFYKIGDATGVIHSQRFIGSSDKKIYELTRRPETKNNTQLFIDGIYQIKDTYNVTSNILTLNDFPTDGSEIEVIIISSTLYSDLDKSAHNLTYDPVGDGTVTLSIEDKLRSITGFVDSVQKDSLIKNMNNVSGIHDSVIFVSGFWEYADNGGGFFFWDSTAPKSEHNGGTIIDPSKCIELEDGSMSYEYFVPMTEGTGCWKRIYSGNIDVKWFGAKGNDDDDTYSLQNAVNHPSHELEFSDGTYTTFGITIDRPKKIILNESTIIKLKNNANNNLIQVVDLGTIDGFTFIGGTLDCNRDNQSFNKDAIESFAYSLSVNDCIIKNAGRFAISSKNITDIKNVTIKNCRWGISTTPDRENILEQINISNCDIITERTGIEVVKSTNDEAHYVSVIIENNRVDISDNEYSNVFIACKTGLRFAGNHLVNGNKCLFKDGDGGVISSNIFENQITSIEINNYSTLNVADNHLRGGTNSVDGIVHVSETHTRNNSYNNNYIENYSNSVASFVDDNNELSFINNTCHDSPLILYNSCEYSISGNRFMNNNAGVLVHGSKCSPQSGIISNNRYSNVEKGIILLSRSAHLISRVTILGNLFSNVSVCIEHNKNYGGLEDVSITENTFMNYGTLLRIPEENDIPTSMLWKNNKGDIISINSPGDVPYSKIHFGEKILLNDINNLEIYVGNNTHAVGQQLKIAYYGNTHEVTLHVPNDTSGNTPFVFGEELRYLVLEWTGEKWEYMTYRYATVDYPGIIQLATMPECFDGTNETKAVTPAGLKMLLNDDGTAITHGWSSTKITEYVEEEISEAINDIPYATTSVRGLIKLATMDECIEGDDSVKAVTPIGLRGLLHDDDVNNITTWSSLKIQDYVDLNTGVVLNRENDLSDECPLIFIDKEFPDQLKSAMVSPHKLYYVPERGSLNAAMFNSLSDERYKNTINTIKNPLDTISKLRGVSFNWNHDGTSSYGVIAQELEQILPELVSVSKDGVKSVNYDGLVGFLIEAIKKIM